nr:pyridoxal phosphate-dependent transferase [Tanacetum cinerariifolium]
MKLMREDYKVEWRRCIDEPTLRQRLHFGYKYVDLIFIEPFWMQNAVNSEIVISGWHRLGYWYDHGDTMSIELEKHIRQLHSLVGNAVIEALIT